MRHQKPQSASSVTGDLPSGETPESQSAEVLEDSPSGKRSKTEAKEEDVDMQNAEEEQQEEDPQDKPMDEPDSGPAEEKESSSDSINSFSMNRADELENSEIYEANANGDVDPDEKPHIEQRPRIATRAQAKFFRNLNVDSLMELCLQKEMSERRECISE